MIETRESVEIIASNLGSLLTLFALVMTTSIIIAIVWGEWYAIPGIAAAAAITGVSGQLLVRSVDSGDAEEVHGIVTAAVGWLLAGVYGSLPILFVAYTITADPGWLATPRQTPTVAVFQSSINALFESVSGVTGTGLTMAEKESELPRTIQWWRSLMQWVGGIGVVVLAAAIVLTAESEAFQSLYEERGAVTSLRSDTQETIKLVWWIFCLLTFVATVAFWLAGMPIWHALNHAMTGTSTGGFTVTANGIGAYDSTLVEAVIVPFMLLGAISFAVHYHFLQGEVDLFWDDAQTRWLFVLTAIGAVIVGGLLLAINPPLEAVRYGGFQLVSALTCTGFQTDAGIGNRWPVAGQLIVVSAMLIGGAAGSTAGGIKLIRAISLTKGTFYSVTEYFYEEDPRSFDIADEEADVTAGQASAEFDQAAVVGFLWIVMLALVVLVSLIGLPTGQEGYPLGDVLFEAASAQGNVGLSSGITDPGMPISVKLVFIASMWIGRLEIIPVLVMMRVLVRGFE